ncbi:hypothetical protein PCYB_062930 [Plasmodium cynomolgi strain B]|uniref:TRUD domain-containing protein n=1 Tax=Plasmodium cynomolgi (strain B) TaxID=1120755 RepID=K6UCW5_PLACD|nr:hypothetical protein PCYB_062930 [Plasmodium cynomolgi strain B]GAB65561.1 hypothetical protein PCYB_062930 [Plasmodium cynomolgi strain B]
MDGIEGKIKTMYEDFHVHEITRNNNILHLEQLIHREKINQIIHQNEEDEREKIIRSISKTELHLHVLAKYVNKDNVKTFRQFLTLLHDIYQLKLNSEAGELPQELPRDGLKKMSIPYCLFIHLDEMPTPANSHLDENGNSIRGEEPLCSEGLPQEDPTDGNKTTRRNIHNVIKQYYPFLLTETKNVPQSQSVLSHGNILQGNANCENNSVEFIKEKKDDAQISAIQIYPSFNCLKTLLPQNIFNKLKGNAKKSRFSQNDELENIICQKLDQMEEKKKITKLPEQVRQFCGEGISQESSNAAMGFFENKKRKIECGTLAHSFDGNCTGGGNKKVRGEEGGEAEVKMEVKSEVKAEGRATTANLRENPPRDDSKDKAKGGDTPKGITPICDEEGVPPNGHVPPYSVGKNGNTGHTYSNQLNHEEHSENATGGNFLDKLNDHRKKKNEQKKGKKYLHFNLYKENKDICEVLHKIKINLKKKNGDISYCGIKDKRGITVQRFCIHKAKKFDLFRLIMGGDSVSRDRGGDRGGDRSGGRSGDRRGDRSSGRSGDGSSGRSGDGSAGRGDPPSWCNNVYVSNLSYKKKKLSLGDLQGNFFKVLIRGVEDTSEEKFCALADNFRKAGFVNYFGHQRFGSKQIKNYEIGICILKKNYKQALFHVIENAGLDSSKKGRLIEYLNELDATNRVEGEEEVVVLTTPNDESHVWKDEKDEKDKKTILCSLKNDKKFKNAFMNLPKDIFSLFIHSTQSLIFNILADVRMKKYGFAVVVGDLIESSRNNEEALSSDNFTEHHSDESESGEPLYETNIIVVTPENISLYDIYDVVLPFPGDKNFVFPPNLTEEYKSVLSNLRLSLDDFRSEKNFFSAPGGYRKVVVKPRDFKSLFIKSDAAGGGRIPFIRSDLTKLVEQEGWAPNSEANSAERSEEPNRDAANPAATTRMADEMQTHITFVQSDVYHEHLIKEVPNYRTTASVLLTCSLPKSSYITVALLEVLNS